MNSIKICVVTGTRAEYGLLYWLLKKLKDDSAFTLQIAVTGMHLSTEFGNTYKEIEKDGFEIDEKIEILLASDTPVGISKSIGLGVIGFSEFFERKKPDIIVLLGDRFELLAAAQAAMVSRIPIAHIAGGDVTQGLIDEAIRHSITKMSHLHFVTNEESAVRVRQLGENPKHVFNYGSPAIDAIKNMDFLTREILEKELDFKFRRKNILVTFHPVTLEVDTAISQVNALLDAIDAIGNDLGVIFTMPNSDTDGRSISSAIREYSSTRPNTKCFKSLGQKKYLSTMALVDAVVGNSSSGLYETPFFKIPTVNIGKRQLGRHQQSSILNCDPNKEDIQKSIQSAFEMNCSNLDSPYGDGTTSEKIISTLKSIPNFKDLLIKKFFSYPGEK